MDLGIVNNAVARRDDGLRPAEPWFLVDLNSPGYTIRQCSDRPRQRPLPVSECGVLGVQQFNPTFTSSAS